MKCRTPATPGPAGPGAGREHARCALFAVGDDWQSINRFAGADLSVMTRFDDWFGTGEMLRLERTFRSPQSICDISSRFVSKNPDQLPKQVRSEQPEPAGPALRAVAVEAEDQYAAVITSYLQHLDSDRRNPPDGGRLQVYILGRYNNGKSKSSQSSPTVGAPERRVQPCTAPKARKPTTSSHRRHRRRDSHHHRG